MSSSRPTAALLEMRGISKTFPGVRALDNVCLTVHPGEIHSLMGENGAGKSTLMKILSGAHRRDGGTIQVNQREIDISSPRAAREAGIAIIYQELTLVPQLAADENIHLGREPTRGPGFVGCSPSRH